MVPYGWAPSPGAVVAEGKPVPTKRNQLPHSPGFSHEAAWTSRKCAAAMLRPDDTTASRLSGYNGRPSQYGAGGYGGVQLSATLASPAPPVWTELQDTWQRYSSSPPKRSPTSAHFRV